MSEHPVFTIGHSTQSAERLAQLLSQNGITAVADVRSSPYSRMNPQFNRETLKAFLQGIGIAYVFLGDLLGARPKNRAAYRNGRVDYDLLAATDEFKRGLERLRAGSETYRIAMMCAEKEPLDCHRTILVARHLVELGTPVFHILADGSSESHAEALERLLKRTRGAGTDLFVSRDQILNAAYQKRGEEIAYSEEARTSALPVP